MEQIVQYFDLLEKALEIERKVLLQQRGDEIKEINEQLGNTKSYEEKIGTIGKELKRS
jgi:hypothetical protein